MNLKELRKKWEKGQEVLMEVVHPAGEVLVTVYNEEDGDTSILRYFKVGDKWEVSVDQQIMRDKTEALYDIMNDMTRYFKDVMPTD